MQSFWLQGEEPLYCESFRKNIKRFCSDYGTRVEPLPLQHVNCWVVVLKGDQDSEEVRLHIYEESVTTDPASCVCDQCRIIGACIEGPVWSIWPNVDILGFHFYVPHRRLSEVVPLLSPWKHYLTSTHTFPGWQHHPVSNRRYHFIIPSQVPISTSTLPAPPVA